MMRFRLRTLLLLTLALGGGLGWWFRPFTHEERWPDGQLKAQLRVQRSWNGSWVSSGQQSWWWSNGQLARRGQSYGQQVPRRASGIGLSLTDEVAFDINGKPMPSHEITGSLLWLGFERWQFDEVLPMPVSPDDRFAETPHD